MIIVGDSLVELKKLADNSIDSIVTDPPYGLKFMGKKWDYDVPSVEIWKECLRVLKPGGHVLSFSGTRTYHRMVVAMEDAGFEIRDQIQWIYGSGFPKSHNIKEGEFKGWGTALKPANEPICLARKPLDGTVAENVETWGVGGLNIDASRIGYANESDKKLGQNSCRSKSKGMQFYAERKRPQFDRSDRSHLQGRWPANVIFDEKAAAVLDEQSGILKTGTIKPHVNNAIKKDDGSGKIPLNASKSVTGSHEGASGGASRFFYVAKASKRERNAGLDGMPAKDWKDQGFRDNDSTHLSPRAGAGRTSSNQNHHPTVKPIKLMEYLCKLITPPQGTILDPFMGSGSTGAAAKRLGFEFIGVELNPEYAEIAERRIKHAQELTQAATEVTEEQIEMF
jgi:site-specific DNA-methyltransferase (adenine-specific)